MSAHQFLIRLKPWMLPIAMIIGLLFHKWIGHLSFATPYLIFAMLLITFCRINPREFRPDGMIAWLLIVQILGCIAIFWAIRPLGLDIAQGIMICVLCPTATAAPVVTGMLGGSVPRLVTYSLISNITVALLAPAILLMASPAGNHIAFFDAFSRILSHVGPLILLPLVAALLMMRYTPRLHRAISGHQSISFYLWAISLTIVVGNSVAFVMAEPIDRLGEVIALAIGAGIVCVAQFGIGRLVGRRYGDKISAAQGLGQKNTVLAIWLALSYLNPISSVAPAAYIAWQNTINSVQLYFHQKKLLRLTKR